MHVIVRGEQLEASHKTSMARGAEKGCWWKWDGQDKRFHVPTSMRAGMRERKEKTVRCGWKE
jgi:hypothetical protein